MEVLKFTLPATAGQNATPHNITVQQGATNASSVTGLKAIGYTFDPGQRFVRKKVES